MRPDRAHVRLPNGVVHHSGVEHHSNVTKAQDVTDAIYDFEELVDLAAARHFDKHHVIERALNVNRPTADDLRPLRSLLCNRQRAYYFWTNLRNPNWFPILLEDKLFELSPNATSKDDSCTEDEFFPQAEYLKKIASMHPADIARIVEDRSITQNGIVARDLANVILALPISQAGEQVAKKTTKRLLELDRGGIVPEILGKLCMRLADESNGKSIRLAGQLLTVLSDDEGKITCVIDADTQAEWMYGRVSGALVPIVAQKYPLPMVNILSQQLRLWIWNEYPGSRDDPTGDGSHYKRLKIGADSNQHGEALLHTLVDCLVKALMIAQSSDDDTVAGVFETIKNVPLPIFRRIEMYVMSDTPKKHRERIAELVRDPKIVRNPVLDFELGALLKRSFPELPDAAKEAYLQIVDHGPADPEDH